MAILVGVQDEAFPSGFRLIPNPPQEGVNLFSGTLKADAELARDTFFAANPDQLIKYDNDAFLLIQIKYTSPSPVFEFELRSGGTWVNAFAQAVGDVALSTHSVTELLDVSSSGSGQIITNEERTKLAGIQAEATKNQTDSCLLDRANHTGVQTISTVSGLQTALDGKATTGHTHDLNLTGDATGTAMLGETSVDLNVTVQDNSHNHTIANVTGLQTALDGKQDKLNGLSVHRFIQVSNGANSTITVNNITTTTILPLLATGSFNASFNNPTGYGSLDLVNNWIDVSNINSNANLLLRATLANNGGGTVVNATLVMRLITDKNNPSVFTDILNVPESFGTQAAFITMAFSGGIDAIQVGIRTTQSEDIRLSGVYLVISDPIVYP